MKTEEYLRILEEQIRCKKARGMVTQEIRVHIEEQTASYLAAGMEQEQAEAAAVKEMGDPVEAGTELDRIHRPKMAWGMIGLICALSVIGLTIQYFIQLKFENNGGINFDRQLFFLVMGLGLMAGICFADYSWIGRYAREITIFLALGLWVGGDLFGKTVNGGRYWIALFGNGIDVRMLVMLLIPLYGGILYYYRGGGYRALLKCICWMLPGVWFGWRMPSARMTVVMFLSYALLLGIAVYRNWFRVSRKMILTAMGAVLVILPVVIGFAIMRFGAVYQRERLLSLANLAGVSPQAGMAKSLLAGSRLLGSGHILPELEYYEPDYVMAFAASYYGILAVMLVMGMIAFLLFHFLHISLHQKNRLGMMMGTGCSIVLILQVIFFVVNNLGIIPMNVYCPFLTYGGSGGLVLYILFGLMLSIYRYQNVMPEPVTGRKTPKTEAVTDAST